MTSLQVHVEDINKTNRHKIWKDSDCVNDVSGVPQEFLLLFESYEASCGLDDEPNEAGKLNVMGYIVLLR